MSLDIIPCVYSSCLLFTLLIFLYISYTVTILFRFYFYCLSREPLVVKLILWIIRCSSVLEYVHSRCMYIHWFDIDLELCSITCVHMICFLFFFYLLSRDSRWIRAKSFCLIYWRSRTGFYSVVLFKNEYCLSFFVFKAEASIKMLPLNVVHFFVHTKGEIPAWRCR